MIQALLLATAAAAAFQIPVPQRGRDPWVFRSVLDQRPRIVTVALSREMWLAYDAQTCGLARIWKGGVKLQGAVYTSVHGEQPVSVGTRYDTCLAGPVWTATVGGKPVAVESQWRGYFYKEGRVHLQYQLRLPDGRFIDLQETPEITGAENLFPTEAMLAEKGLVFGMPCLYRSFSADAVPDGVELRLKMRSEFESVKWQEFYPPVIDLQKKLVEEPDANGVVTKYVDWSIPFTGDFTLVNVGMFYYPLPDDAPPADGAKQDAAKQDASKTPAPKPGANDAKKGG